MALFLIFKENTILSTVPDCDSLTRDGLANIVVQSRLIQEYPYTTMTSQTLKDIENKLDELISLCNRLEKENATLKAKEESWKQERTRLLEKNEIARSRVEAMIARLKNLETE